MMAPGEAAERLAVMREAESWIGTPYHSNADVKGAGVDCGMLLVRCFVDTGLVPAFDPRPYPNQWMLHQSAEKFLEIVRGLAREIAPPPQKGDIVVFKIGRLFAHGSLVDEWPYIIHATDGVCIRESVEQNARLSRMEPRFFSFWAARGGME